MPSRSERRSRSASLGTLPLGCPGGNRHRSAPRYMRAFCAICGVSPQVEFAALANKDFARRVPRPAPPTVGRNKCSLCSLTIGLRPICSLALNLQKPPCFGHVGPPPLLINVALISLRERASDHQERGTVQSVFTSEECLLEALHLFDRPPEGAVAFIAGATKDSRLL